MALAACTSGEDVASEFVFDVVVGRIPPDVTETRVDGVRYDFSDEYPSPVIHFARTFESYDAANARPPIRFEFLDASGAVIHAGTTAPGACEANCGISCVPSPALEFEGIEADYETLAPGYFGCMTCRATGDRGFGGCH